MHARPAPLAWGLPGGSAAGQQRLERGGHALAATLPIESASALVRHAADPSATMARLLAVGALLAPASAAGCGFEAYPDDDASWESETVLERRSRLNAARQTRLSDLDSLTPDKDDSLEARQRRLFQIDVKSKTREERSPSKNYTIYGPALLDVSDHRTGGSSPQAPAEQRRLLREHALEYPLRVFCEVGKDPVPL